MGFAGYCGLLLFATTTPIQQPPDKPAEKPASEQKRDPEAVRAEIARLRQQLAKLEKELVTLEKPTLADLNTLSIEVGKYGMFGGEGVAWSTRVVEVIDESSMMIEATGRPNPNLTVIVTNYPTAGLADGKILDAGIFWRVIGTRKRGTKTYYVVEPVTLPKK